MTITLTAKINNYSYTDNPVRIKDGRPVFSWEFDPLTIAETDEYTGIIQEVSESYQKWYEIRIGSLRTELGTDYFYGDLVQTPLVYTNAKSWTYDGYPLARGTTYYAQIRISDNYGTVSDWSFLSFRFNALPIVTSGYIYPATPTTTDSLQLVYTYYDEDDPVPSLPIIRWFKNGVRQTSFDGLSVVPSSFLQNGDMWAVDILPFDGYEYGRRFTTAPVVVSVVSPVISSCKILPDSPEENDILRAYCTFEGDFIISQSEIHWYLNGQIMRDYDNQEYARLPVSPGDSVYFEIKPNNGTAFVASASVTIRSGEFVVKNIRIDNQIEPMFISTFMPTLTWDVYHPVDRYPQRLSVKLGTYYGSDNIYSEVVPTKESAYTLPGNLVQKGKDYYIALAVSDTDTFSQYTVSKFRMSGFRWDTDVDNARGWTVETTFTLNSTEDFDILKYQVIRIQDGARFGEVRIHSGQIGFVSTTSIYSGDINTSGLLTLTICGRGNTVKVYFNRELLLDATDRFDQPSTSKYLEFGVSAQSSSLSATYQYVNYTTSGMYEPGSPEFSTAQFYNYFELPYYEMNGLRPVVQNSVGMKVFAANPDLSDENGAVYSIQPGDPISGSTVTRSFSPISHIRLSPDGKITAFSHARGASLFSSYAIATYDIWCVFTGTGAVLPNAAGWELVQNVGSPDAAYLNSSGLNINTLFEQVGKLST